MTFKLRTKITLGLGLTLVPVLVLGLISFGWSSTLTQGVAAGYQTRAESIGDRIDRFLFERYGDVQAFAVNSAVQRRASWYDRDDEDNAVTLAMNRYMALYGVYALMVAVDLDGKVIGLSTSDARGRPLSCESLWARNFKSAPWFAPARDGDFTTSMPYSASGNDQATGTVIVDPYAGSEVRGAVDFADGATMGFAAPIKGESGEVIGVWVNFLDLASLESVATAGFSDFRALGASSGELRIVDKEGRTLLAEVQGRRPDGFQSQREVVDDPITAQALKGVNAFGPVEDSRTGRTSLVGSAHLRGAMGYPGMDWAVVIAVDEAEALAGVSRVQWTIAIVLAVCVIAAALVMLTLVRQISAPIRRMTSAAKRVALGDVGGDIHHEGTDEIGELASALRDMVGFVRENAAAAAALAEGDLSKAPRPRSADDLLATSFVRAQETLGRMLVEARGLITSAQEGRLAERVDATSYGGAYRALVTGINELMAACQAPISEAKTVLIRVAERDLSIRMTGEYKGDWEQVKSSINSALDNLEDAMSQVLVAADQVSTATTEITIGTQSLAQTATTQAGALDEVTSRLHDVSSAGRQTASNAQEARSMAQSANDSAGRGRASMLELSRAIQEIKAASDRTAQIVKTIDEIAFQTNLLALNAAVEAARAGDAGRGFAVVADEVRSLAMRSAEAARTTAKTINEAVESAERGVALNAGVAKDLAEIDGQVRRVVEVMQEIAVAADAQSRGIVTANGSVEAISRAVQQNAATTEEAASGAEELAGQAQSLRELVAAFKVQARPGLYLAPALATGAWRAKAKARPPAPARSSRRPRAQMGSAAQLIPFDEHESSPGGDF